MFFIFDDRDHRWLHGHDAQLGVGEDLLVFHAVLSVVFA